MTTEIESIGLAMDTSGVERGIRSLDELAARGPKVEKSLKGVETAATEAGKGVSSLGASNSKGLDDVAKAGDRAAEGLNKTSQAARSAVSSQQALAAAVAQFTNVERSYVQSLVDEYKQLSMGRAERAAYIAQSKGMSSAAQEVARAVGQKIEAHRKEQEEAKKAVASAESLGRAWNAVGNVIGGVAVAMAGNFSYRTFIRETIQAEQEQTQLAAVLRSTGESAGWSAQRLNEMADALSSRNGKSIFSSGEITQAQTRLLSYTGIVGEQLPRAMQNAIDMSSRMGMDLKSSAETIGRALDVPSEGLTALQRQGFRFTEAQKIMVKQLEETGRASEAQAIVLQALESSYGGAAVAARDTFGGSLAALRSSVNDLMTGSGGNLNDMKSGVEALNEALGSEQTRAAFQTFVGWMGQVSAVSVNGAANLIAFLGATDKLAIISGSDAFGKMKASAAGYSRELEQLTGKAERFQEAINRGDNVTQNQRNLEKTRAKIAEVQSQSLAASDALKTFAGGVADTGSVVASVTPQIEGQGAALGKTAEFIMKYGSASEKAAAAVAKARKEYGAAFTPEMQKQIEAFYAKQDKGANAAAAAMKTEQSAYQATVAAIQAKIAEHAQELMYSGRLTESDKLRIKLMSELDAGAKTLTASHKASALALLDKLASQERERDVIKESVALYKQQADIQEELAADYVAQSKAREAGRQAVNDYAKGIQESNDALQYELSLMGLGEQAREVALEQYRIELELKKQIAAIDANSGFENEAQREAERARVRAAAAIAKANASSKVFVDNWKESIKQYDDIFKQGFADMLNNGEYGWKSFTKSLVTTFKTSVADQIYRMFAQPFVVRIVGQMMGLTGGSGIAGSVSGMASGSSSIMSLGKTIYDAVSNGFSGISNEIAYAVQRGLNFLNPSGALGAPGGVASGIGSLGGYAAGIGGGIMGGRLISGGYSAWGSSGNSAVNMGTAVGTLFGPIGSLVGGLLGGTINRLFGRKLKDSGIEGEFGGETGFEGNTYQYYKGGLFRSNKTVRGELDEELRKALADQFTYLKTGTEAMAETLGLGTTAIDDFTASLKVSFQGLSEEEIQAKLEEELAKIGESLAGLTLGTDEFNRAGETSAEALTRLSTSIVAVNGVFDSLGQTLYATSLAGADMASSLVDLFGGVDGFNSATGSYFQNFYSPEEQRAAMERQLQQQLSAMNLTLPDIDAADARAQYRALAEAQDRTTESGRKTWAMLIQLSDSFASVTTAAEDMREQIASQRLSLEERLLKAGGDDRGALEMRRKQEYDALNKLDPELAKLVSQIYALEDASAIASKRFDVEQRLLIAQGKDREALDLRRQQEWDALYKLDPALAKMISQVWELEDAAQAVADKEAARSNAMRDLSDAMGRQTEVWEAQLSAIDTQRQVQQEALGLITGIFDLVRSNARDLYGEVQSTAAMQATQGNAFIAQALATAKRTGYLPEQDALQQAISGARSGLDNNNFASQVDADFARLVLAGQLKGLEEIAGPQKTAAEQQLDRLDAQTDALNKQIREQQKQYDLIQRQIDIENGTYNATITVAEATAKIIELLGGKAPAGVGSGAVDNSGAAWGGSAAGTGAAGASSKYRRMFSIGGSDVGYEAITDASMIDRLDALFDLYHSFDGTGDLLGLGTAFKAAGGTIADLAIMSGHWEREWRDAFATVGLPSFAVGTNYVPQDMVAQIHKGERIVPEADNRALMAAVNGGGQGGNTGRLERLVEVLAQKLDAVTTELEQIKGSTADTRDLIDRVSAGGNSLAVDVMNKPTVAVEGATA